MMMRRQSQPSSRVFNELSLLLYNLLQSPPSPMELFSGDHPSWLVPSSSSPPSTPPAARLRRRVVSAPPPPITPSGFASLLLGISTALMLCGSVTFLIGIMLMPWVLGLVMLFYFVGFVSSLSVLGRSIFCYASSAASYGGGGGGRDSGRFRPHSSHKEFPSWKAI